MVKTKITETTETYDKEGHLIEKVIREETSEDDSPPAPNYGYVTTPYYPLNNPWEMTWCNSHENG